MLRYSIIVPVYNVDPYLRECLDGILAQDSPSEYEVILVDDGSTDNSGAICDEYAEKHPRFRAIHQKNRGVSESRNTGMDAAGGEFVLFLDSDDRWRPNLLSSVDETISQTADMTLFFYRQFDESEEFTEVLPSVLPRGESGSEYVSRVLQNGDRPVWNVWSWVYRRAFLTENGLSFEQRFSPAEDSEFNLRAYQAAQSVSVVPKVLYEYRVRGGSISKSPSAARWHAEIDVIVAWFRAFPYAPVADYFLLWGMMLSKYGNRSEKRKMVEHYAENEDILKHCSNSWKHRMIKLLFRLFGFYGGSKAYILLHKIYRPKENA